MTGLPANTRLRPFRPTPFGRYTLLLPLSTGGMGEIYLAQLQGPGDFEKLCAIKRILPQLVEDEAFIERFLHEARTLVKLTHGSIAQVFDMGVSDGAPYLALEYVDGKDLRKVAARAKDRGVPLPLPEMLFVMGRVLDALAYAHRKRDEDEREIELVHRDISPQNLLVSYEGEVKVIDFGLAKSTLSEAKTHPRIILGKFLYMSPEQARQQKVDPRSDLYSVGLCLYELLSGHNPFDEVAAGDLMGVVANPEIPPLDQVAPHCPPAVSACVMKALAVDPSERFQSAEAFRAEVQHLLHGLAPLAGPESLSRFLRESFAQDYAAERKLLAKLRDFVRSGGVKAQSLQRPEMDTAVFELREVSTRSNGQLPTLELPTVDAAPPLTPSPVTLSELVAQDGRRSLPERLFPEGGTPWESTPAFAGLGLLPHPEHVLRPLPVEDSSPATWAGAAAGWTLKNAAPRPTPPVREAERTTEPDARRVPAPQPRSVPQTGSSLHDTLPGVPVVGAEPVLTPRVLVGTLVSEPTTVARSLEPTWPRGLPRWRRGSVVGWVLLGTVLAVGLGVWIAKVSQSMPTPAPMPQFELEYGGATRKPMEHSAPHAAPEGQSE